MMEKQREIQSEGNESKCRPTTIVAVKRPQQPNNDQKEKDDVLTDPATVKDDERWTPEQQKPLWSADNLQHQGEDETHHPIPPAKQTTGGDMVPQAANK
jgi:hypothetical protein